MRRCSLCSSDDLVSIGMTLASGPVEFTHCRACEHRVWIDVREGRTLRLDDVLVGVGERR